MPVNLGLPGSKAGAFGSAISPSGDYRVSDPSPRPGALTLHGVGAWSTHPGKEMGLTSCRVGQGWTLGPGRRSPPRLVPVLPWVARGSQAPALLMEQRPQRKDGSPREGYLVILGQNQTASPPPPSAHTGSAWMTGFSPAASFTDFLEILKLCFS